MNLFSLFRRKPHERPGFMLYGAAVGAARDDWFYRELAVPDTLDGRFDTVGLHVALLIHRLRRDASPDGAAMAQAVFDAMFADMDVNLREMGVGDLSVGKKVRAMWEAFHGRAKAYEAEVEAGDDGALAQALRRNSTVRGGAFATRSLQPAARNPHQGRALPRPLRAAEEPTCRAFDP